MLYDRLERLLTEYAAPLTGKTNDEVAAFLNTPSIRYPTGFRLRRDTLIETLGLQKASAMLTGLRATPQSNPRKAAYTMLADLIEGDGVGLFEDIDALVDDRILDAPSVAALKDKGIKLRSPAESAGLDEPVRGYHLEYMGRFDPKPDTLPASSQNP